MLFLNPDSFGRLFKREAGMRFSDFVTAMRIEKAKELIVSFADMKVYEIAKRVGFGDQPAYFGQVFRRYTGMLLSEYRKRSATAPGGVTNGLPTPSGRRQRRPPAPRDGF